MKTPLFQGAATALITPMKKDGSVDVQALEKLIEYQLENGVQALVPCGTTGEPATLSLDEWQEVIRRTVAQVRHRIPVIAGTGGRWRLLPPPASAPCPYGYAREFLTASCSSHIAYR